MRTGVDLSKGRFRDIVGEVEVEFLPVDPKWLDHLMLRTNWYYEGADVPVLQLVFPDLENRFQWEDGFTDHFRQLMLACPVIQSKTWSRIFGIPTILRSALPDWNFPDPPLNAGSLLSNLSRSQNDEEPFTYAARDDGEWLFLGDQMTDGGGPVRSRLTRVLPKDPTLFELADLPVNWYATRSEVGAPWERFGRGIQKSRKAREGGLPLNEHRMC